MRIGLIKHTTIFFITLFPTLSVAATDIKTICNGGGGSSSCTINSDVTALEIGQAYTSIINNATILGNASDEKLDDAIKFTNSTEITINEFINNGTIKASRTDTAIFWDGKKTTITTFINNGIIEGAIELSDGNSKITTLNNYGIITGGISQASGGNGTINTLNNYGYIYTSAVVSNSSYYTHLNESNSNNINIGIGVYHLDISEDSTTFNNFAGYTSPSNNTSHLAIDESGSSDSSPNVKLKDSASRFLLSISSNFELNKDYSLDKLVVKTDGSKYTLKYNDGSDVTDLFSHLSTTNPIFILSKNGNSFRITTNTDNGVGNTHYKGLIQSMNTFILHSNSTIFSSNSNTINTSRIASNYDYGLSNIRENERFYYSNNNLINQRQNMQRRGFVGDRQSSSTKATASNYHFFFTPFITHNVLNESNGMGASGLNYGFISGFSGMLGDSNTLGVHLGFNYGGISGENNLTKTDIKTMGLLLGLHYKLDLVYDMYIKAIGNAFYFLNNIDYQTGLATSSKQSPNDLAFSGSLYYGKDFDFSTFGKLGLEAGVNYQGIQSDKIDFNEESYKSKLINLIYIDVGSNYTKVFDSGFGFNLNLGIKTLINEAKAKMTILGIETDFTIGADRFLGYAGAGVSYFINKQVELNLSYLGSFGDKSMSNSGFFNARFWW